MAPPPAEPQTSEQTLGGDLLVQTSLPGWLLWLLVVYNTKNNRSRSAFFVCAVRAILVLEYAVHCSTLFHSHCSEAQHLQAPANRLRSRAAIGRHMPAPGGARARRETYEKRRGQTRPSARRGHALTIASFNIPSTSILVLLHTIPSIAAFCICGTALTLLRVSPSSFPAVAFV